MLAPVVICELHGVGVLLMQFGFGPECNFNRSPLGFPGDTYLRPEGEAQAFFGSARAIPESLGGGSLTIISTALVETIVKTEMVFTRQIRSIGW